MKAKEQQEKDYVENIKTKKSAKAKVRHESLFFFFSSLNITGFVFFAYRERLRQLNLTGRMILWRWT